MVQVWINWGSPISGFVMVHPPVNLCIYDSCQHLQGLPPALDIFLDSFRSRVLDLKHYSEASEWHGEFRC